MSWQIPLSIGLLYLCVGILFFNSGIFNYSGYGALTVTTTTTISVWNLEPTPTMLSDGYIPYKKLSVPRADNIGLVPWSEDVSIKRARQQQGEDSTPIGALDIAPGCPLGKKSCGNLGRPVCLPSSQIFHIAGF